MQARTVWIQIRLQILSKKVSEYDQKIPQSQTEGKPTGPRGEPHNHHETPGRQTKQSNHFSLPYQDDCKTRMNIKPGLKAPVAV